MKAVKLGFVGLDTPDPEALAAHYQDVLGLPLVDRSADTAYLACGTDRFAVGLHRSTSALGFAHLGLQVTGVAGTRELREALATDGLASETCSDAFPGVSESVVIRDPDGYRLHLYTDIDPAERPAASVGVDGVRARKLGHVALIARDPHQSLDFYTQSLGFRFSDWIDDYFVFMRCNADHHALNFVAGPRRGLFHLALELSDAGAIPAACDRLTGAGVDLEWGPGRHGPGHNLYTYHRDPDGNIVEMFAELDLMSDESLGYWDPRASHLHAPERPRVWSLAEEPWGPPPPPSILGILGDTAASSLR